MNNDDKTETRTDDFCKSEIIPRDTIVEKIEVDELLGSVTTYPEGSDKNQLLRLSARVFKKIKLDACANLNTTAAANIEKSDKKEEPKVETNKKQKGIWLLEDKLLFFEALNEYGKDFESIHNYIVQKIKKRGNGDNIVITKEHVRHLYYKTWHKLSKYLKFAEGTKKIVQELYTLINYGELRKKIGVYSQKISHKLNELIYTGCVALRVKGKTVRVKTPMCRALRRLNKLDDKDDEVKLPLRVLVELRPRDMGAFLKVQNMALNPRIRTILPLQKRLSALMNCITKRWKSAEMEYLKKEAYPYLDEALKAEIAEKKQNELLLTSELKFVPSKDVKITTPNAVIGDYYARDSVCLKAYEDRMGIESCDFFNSLLEKKDSNKRSNSRTKSECANENLEKTPSKENQVNGSEKKSPLNPDIGSVTEINPECFNLDFSILEANSSEPFQKESPVNEPQSFQKESPVNEPPPDEDTVENMLSMFFSSLNKSKEQHVFETKVESTTQPPDIQVEIPLLKTEKDIDNKNNRNSLSKDQLFKYEKICNGWSISECESLTIGELYLMFGCSSKVVLEYYWKSEENITNEEPSSSANHFTVQNEEANILAPVNQEFSFNHALRKLVSIVKLHQPKKFVTNKCTCGHICSPKINHWKKSSKANEIDDKINGDDLKTDIDQGNINLNTEENKSAVNITFDDFLKPQLMPASSSDIMAQLDNIEKLKPKFCIRKGRRLRTKQVVVEREILQPLVPNHLTNGHQIVRMNIISQRNENSPSLPCDSTSNEKVDAEINSIGINSDVDTASSSINKMICTDMNNINEEQFSVLLQGSPRSISPTRLLREGENQWISSEVADFSLSSFLGHLDSPMKSCGAVSPDVDAQVRSLLTDNSFDYTGTFADLANKVASSDLTN